MVKLEIYGILIKKHLNQF